MIAANLLNWKTIIENHTDMLQHLNQLVTSANLYFLYELFPTS